MGRGGHYGGRCDRGGSFQYFLCNISDRAEGPYPTMIGNTAIVSAYDYGRFLGELNVTFNDQGDILGADGDALIMDANVSKDVATVQRIAKAAEPLQSIREKNCGASCFWNRRCARRLHGAGIYNRVFDHGRNVGSGQRSGCADRHPK